MVQLTMVVPTQCHTLHSVESGFSVSHRGTGHVLGGHPSPVLRFIAHHPTLARHMKTVGKVYLVGAGPGDPELLTLKGRRLLEEAEVVVYDFLANAALLRFIPAQAEKIYVGKQGGDHTLSQDRIN